MGIKLKAGSKFYGGVSISTPSPYDDILDENSGWVTVSTFSSQDGDPDFEYIQNSSGGAVSYNKPDYNGLTTIKGGVENPSTYYEFNPTKVATKQITGLVVGQTYSIDVDGTFGFENNNAHSFAKIVVGVTPSNTTGLFKWADISPLLEAHHISETPNPSGGNAVGSLASTSTVEFVATSSTYTVVVSKNSSGSGSDFTIEKMDINMVPAPDPSAVPVFFVHSHVSGRVSVPKVYDGSGNHLFTIHEGASRAAVSAGRIYAGDHNQNRVFVYAQDGSVDFMINTPTTFSAGPHGGHFGQAIAAGYGKVAIGAPRSSENFSQQGAVYVYDADGTNEVKIQRSNPAANDMFGGRILITDAHIFVFSTNSGQFICRYDHDGTNELELTGTITRSSSQFFDNKIVTTSNNGTHVMNPDFTGEVVVAAPSGSDGFGDWSGVDTFNNRLVIQAKNAYYVYDSSDLTSPSNTISVGFSGDVGRIVVAGDKIIGLNNIGTLVKFEIIGTDGTGSYTFNVNAGPYVNLSGGSF